MATAAVTYSFSASTLIKSAEVNTNFSDLVSFLNNQTIHKDASVAFTAVPSGPASDPTGDNQLARKRYVDYRAGFALATATGTIGDSSSYQSLTGGWSLTASLPLGLGTLPDDLQLNTSGWYLVGGDFQVALPSGSGINNVIRGFRIKLAGTVILQPPPHTGTNTFTDKQGPMMATIVQITSGQKLAMDVYENNAASGLLGYTAKLWAKMLWPT